MTLVTPQFFGTLIHSLRWAGDPEPMAVTIGVASDDVVAGTLDDLVDRFAQAFVDNILPFMLDELELVQTELRFQLDAPPADPVVAVSTITDTGAGGGDAIPQNTALLIHKRTGRGGRGGRGRWYIPGISEGNVDSVGNVAGGLITAANTGVAGYLADTSGAAPTSGAVLLHDSEGAFAAEDPDPIITMTCDPLVSTQRRRLRR